MSALPPGWAVATVADLGIDGDQTVMTGPFGSHMRAGEFVETGVPVLTIGCLTESGVSLGKAAYLPADKAADLKRYKLREGDMLFSRMASVGRVGFITAELAGSLFNYHLMRLRLSAEIFEPNLFLAYVKGSPDVRKYLDGVNHGATRDGVNTEQLLAMPVPVPPLNEQRRIVAKLDAILAQTRVAAARFKRLPALLEKLKRSILTAAFRGDLTADWRAANPDVEPASALLDRIRTERRRRWEANLRGKGKDPTKAIYGEFAPDSIGDLPELPRGWGWAGLTEVAEIQLGQRRAPEYAGEAEFPYVRAANITWRGLDLTDLKTMGFVDTERLFLKRGDVLLSEASGSATEVGKPGLWQDEVPNCCFQATVLRLRPNDAILNGEWLYYSCLADATLGRFAAMAPGIGILHLTAERMRRWPIAVAPMAEQLRLVEVMREIMTRLYATEDRIATFSTRIERVEQTALAKAFRGELVPQDPNDEPAAALLDRIRATRVAASAERTGRGRRPHPADAPTSGDKSNGHNTIASSDDSLDLVVAALQQGEPRLTAAAIAEATHLDAPAVKQVIKTLVAAGQVRVHGKARGTSYEWIA